MLLKGMLLGVSIAAPVGPIGLLCFRRGLEGGFWPAFTAGLGAASADALYGLVGAMGLTAITSLLLTQADWLRLLGGVFLLWLAWGSWHSQPAERAAAGQDGLWRGYVSTFLLTLSNPMTILSFAALFAGLGVASGNRQDGLWLVLGVFLGSALWWSVLATLACTAASYATPARLHWLNRGSALLLAGFGVWALAGR